MSKRLDKAEAEYAQAQRGLQRTATKVRDITQRLFEALKEQEQAGQTYSKAASRLIRARGQD